MRLVALRNSASMVAWRERAVFEGSGRVYLHCILVRLHSVLGCASPKVVCTAVTGRLPTYPRDADLPETVPFHLDMMRIQSSTALHCTALYCTMLYANG